MGVNLKVVMVRSLFKRELKTPYYGAQNSQILVTYGILAIKSSKREQNKLLDHFNCILVVGIDSSICGRNLKEIYF